MRRNEQANLLSIFAFIFAGIQGLAVMLFGLYVVSMGGVLIMSALDQNALSKPEIFLVPGLIVLIFGAMCIYGLVNIYLNITMARSLRSKRPPTQKRMIITSVFNLCSFICGGFLIAPFGIAIGVFGIVVAKSDLGKANLAGTPIPTTLPSNPENRNAHQEHIWRQ